MNLINGGLRLFFSIAAGLLLSSHGYAQILNERLNSSPSELPSLNFAVDFELTEENCAHPDLRQVRPLIMVFLKEPLNTLLSDQIKACVLTYAFADRGKYISLINLDLTPLIQSYANDPEATDRLFHLMLAIDQKWYLETYAKRILKREIKDSEHAMWALSAGIAYIATNIWLKNFNFTVLKEIKRYAARLVMKPSFIRLLYAGVGVADGSIMQIEQIRDIRAQLKQSKASDQPITGESLDEIWHSPLWHNDRLTDNHYNDFVDYGQYQFRREIAGSTFAVFGLYALYGPFKRTFDLGSRVKYSIRSYLKQHPRARTWPFTTKKWAGIGGALLVSAAGGLVITKSFDIASQKLIDFSWEETLSKEWRAQSQQLASSINAKPAQTIELQTPADPAAPEGIRSWQLRVFDELYQFQYQTEQLANFKRGPLTESLRADEADLINDYLCRALRVRDPINNPEVNEFLQHRLIKLHKKLMKPQSQEALSSSQSLLMESAEQLTKLNDPHWPTGFIKVIEQDLRLKHLLYQQRYDWDFYEAFLRANLDEALAIAIEEPSLQPSICL